MSGTPTFLNTLRIWLGFVAFMAVGNTVQCFISQSLTHEVLYTVDTKNVTNLTARLFGVWTLLAGILRMMCAIDIKNKSLYIVTLFSFFLVQAHFVSEVYYFKTAALTAGIIAPFIVSSVSIVFMLIGYSFITEEDPRALLGDENEQLLKKLAHKKSN